MKSEAKVRGIALEKSLAPDKFVAMTPSDLDNKAKRLVELQGKFDERCATLSAKEGVSSTLDDDELVESQCDALRSKILNRIREMDIDEEKKQTSEVLQQQTAPDGQSVPLANVPEVIPNTWGEFSGDYFEWHRFAKRFKADVHENTKFNANEKMNLLKNACKNHAGRVISNTESDYQKAWEELNEVFGEAYSQMHTCLQRLVTIAKVKKAVI